MFPSTHLTEDKGVNYWSYNDNITRNKEPVLLKEMCSVSCVKMGQHAPDILLKQMVPLFFFFYSLIWLFYLLCAAITTFRAADNEKWVTYFAFCFHDNQLQWLPLLAKQN